MARKVNILTLFCVSILLALETNAWLFSYKKRTDEDSKPPYTAPGGNINNYTSTTEKNLTTETINATTSVPITSHPITDIPTTSIPTTLVTTQPKQPANTESTPTTNRISTELPSTESAVVTNTEPSTGTTIGPSPWQVSPSSSNGRLTSNAASLSCAVLLVVGIFLLT